MSAKQIDLVQGSDSWKAWRHTGLGASDVPSLFNLSPYKTERDLWFEKSGFGEAEEDDSKAYIFQKGHDVEAELRALFEEKTSIQMNPTCFENGIFLASLDGYENGQNLEAKYVGKDVLKKIAGGEIPSHHQIQVQAQLHTSESDKCFYAAKAPKVKGGVCVEIGRNESLIKEIIHRGEAFWDSLKSGKVPQLSPQDIMFITDPAQVALFQKLQELKLKKTEIESQYEEIEKAVKALATHPKVKCGLVSITEAERSGSIDYKKIPEVKALSEEYLETYRGKGTRYKTIRIKGA